MCKRIAYSISLVVLFGAVSGVQAQPFSLMPTHDAEVGNDVQIGPDQNSGGGSGMAFRDIDVRRRVSFVSYDISELKTGGQVIANVSFSNYGHDSGTALVYGVIEELDEIDETTLTWNTAPGVLNDPAPPIGDPVALDYDDLTEELMSFTTPARGVRESTETSQALADFLNSDTDGIVTFLFAPAAGQNNGIVRTKEMGETGGTWLEGELAGLPRTALYPNPADEEPDAPRDVVLDWAPGASADKHDVYFGTDFGSVSQATRTVDPNNVYKGRQDPNHYPVSGTIRLDLGKTYYWRIDEVTADSTVDPGNVWSFTAEPVAYPIEQVLASASSSDVGMGAENTVNGSGLDNDLHSRASSTMWLSSADGPQPSWIEYEFDKVYKLQEMWVWNYNGELILSGYGLENVTIQYSTDGTDYKKFGDTHEFDKAPGTDGYAHDTTIVFGGVPAKYVRITANSNWGGPIYTQYGLSEVRFFYIPVRARVVNPTNGAADVPLDVALDWRPGREAASHEVYFSTNRSAVIDGTAPSVAVSDTSYDPGSLELGETYYWKVNEVNDAESPRFLEGDLWSFSTIECFIVEDFESYTDDLGNRIFQTWLDGVGYSQPAPGYPGNNTGSAVGYAQSPFMEQTIVYDGGQSMPFGYNNTGADGKSLYSETGRTWELAQDWTRKNVQALTLYVRGYPAAFLESPPGIYTIAASGVDIAGTTDEFRFVYKQLSGDGTIEARVLSVENTDPWAKAGVMIRETLDPTSQFAGVYITPERGCRFQLRDASGYNSDTSVTTLAGIQAPHWVKLERIGNTFNAYDSNDPATEGWHLLVWSPQTVTMSSNVYIGLALTSHNADQICEAEFSGVATSPNIVGQWQVEAIGADMPANTTEQLYVAVQDSAGQTAVVDNTDPAAAAYDTWQEWNIAFGDFRASNPAINLASVKTVYIGAGNRNDPQLGGAGTLYVDSIRLYPRRCVASLLKPAGDLSGDDCVVDYLDLEILANGWLDVGDDLSADLDEDSDVDFVDYAGLADTWLDELLWPAP
ncbi:MAG: discoidin domain-containing protein [Phycisphaerales bacterium]|nr:MAG: discoidin domain-containing protein [Phycisphaerales bacterium]